MPKAARLKDMGGPHGCYPPSPIISASSNVFINGQPAARLGDSVAPHDCRNCPSHPRTIASGSASVFINGRPAARAGDAINCGGVIISGSDNVIIGDSDGGNSADIGIIDTVITAVKSFINELGRQAGAELAQSLAEEAGFGFYDKASGKPLSDDEVRKRYQQNPAGILPISEREQDIADTVRQSMLTGAALSGITAYGRRKKIIAESLAHPEQLIKDLKAVLTNMKANGDARKKISEALGELGGLQAQRRLGIKTEQRFVKRFHGPDKLGHDREGRLTEMEFKGNNRNSTAVSRNTSRQKQGSSGNNLKRAKLMRRKLAKVNKPSNRQGGAYVVDELSLWNEIRQRKGNKQHISVHTNTQTGQVKVVNRDNEGDIDSIIDEFNIESFDKAKQTIEDFFK